MKKIVAAGIAVLLAGALVMAQSRRQLSGDGIASAHVMGKWVKTDKESYTLGGEIFQGGKWIDIVYGRPLLRERDALPSAEEAPAPHLQNVKDTVLSELQFSAGTAEYQEDFLGTFVEAGLTAKALSPNTPLVLGRKGVGKTAIFRRLLERQDVPSLPITAPAPLRGGRPLVLTADGFAEVDTLLKQRGANWRQFWIVLSCIACHYGWEKSAARPEPLVIIAPLLPSHLNGESDTLSLLDALFATPRISVAASEWFTSFDQASPGTLLLLFDALDTGFGNDERERERRTSAIEGLCALLIQQAEAVHIKFKVVLREDIWRKLRFENKSHLFGRYVKMDWSDQAAYYKIVLKQASGRRHSNRPLRRV